MSNPNKRDLVFLLDVDNTLLDNDRAKSDVQRKLLEVLGTEGAARFWDMYEQVREKYGVVNYPETLKRFADSSEDRAVADQVAEIVNNVPYKDYVYPGSLPAIQCLGKEGEVAILSDGDEDYQPRKIANAGLAKAVGGPADVLVYAHKETCFEDVMQRLPAEHYVMVDDKEKLLAGAKDFMGDCLTTVWVKQGHYANDPAQHTAPDPDITIQSIGDLCTLSRADFTPESLPAPAAQSESQATA